ncbi:MAG: formyltransferase family protein [Candidatus Choladocola sp.]|nr:formyltransferase family protein [Candidatus Choladocola sp.]
MTQFQKAVVAGTGTLALFCAEKLKAAGLPVTVCDMDQGTPGFLQRRTQSMEIPYFRPEPKLFFGELAKSDEHTLLISAINPYIVPSYVLDNPKVIAINCHQALLPEHPGRNAEMWAIYEGDSKTGITWHMLTACVDGGDILLQKEMEITEHHTAYQVFREQIMLAQKGFEELLPELLEGTLSPKPQEQRANRKLHYSTDVPNQGQLDMGWEGRKISAFLRSMDYGILNVVPRPTVCIDGRTETVRKYKITSEEKYEEGIRLEHDRLFIQKPGLLFELKLEKR